MIRRITALFNIFTTASPISLDDFEPDTREIQFLQKFEINEVREMIEKNPKDFASTFIEAINVFAKNNK